jgi:hypothetical protein
MRTGYTEVRWIKRVGGSSYGTGLPPGVGTLSLIGLRMGKRPVDRRGVGELRAGLVAKDLTRGVLFAPQPLSAEARHELEREGRHLEVVCGEAFLDALIGANIGVTCTAAPLLYLDADLFEELATC